MFKALSGLFSTASRAFSTTSTRCELQLLSRVRVVDNSMIGRNAELKGRPARIIHVYNKKRIAKLGDTVMVAIDGQKKYGIIVGCKQKQAPMIPRYDTNNIVLTETSPSQLQQLKKGEGVRKKNNKTGSICESTPTGTRIRVPLPSQLRTIMCKKKFSKVFACASKFY